MKPLTDYVHKAMIPFAGLPFLAYSISAVPKYAEIVIIVGHLSEQIIGYFGNCYQTRTIHYLKQADPKGTGDALFQFAQIYDPKASVIVWQADQLVYPNEVKRVSQSEANTILFSNTRSGMHEIGLWKVRADSLKSIKGHFEKGEYKALPALQREGFNVIKTRRRKIEISFQTWSFVELRCRKFKQKYLTEFQ